MIVLDLEKGRQEGLPVFFHSQEVRLVLLDQRILDIGCGSGTQTIDLAQLTRAQILAVDNHAPFVDQLERHATELGLGDRITAQVGDMTDLELPDGAFDVIWSEGAIFIMGFAKGLSAWLLLLAPGRQSDTTDPGAGSV